MPRAVVAGRSPSSSYRCLRRSNGPPQRRDEQRSVVGRDQRVRRDRRQRLGHHLREQLGSELGRHGKRPSQRDNLGVGERDEPVYGERQHRDRWRGCDGGQLGRRGQRCELRVRRRVGLREAEPGMRGKPVDRTDRPMGFAANVLLARRQQPRNRGVPGNSTG